MRIAAVQFRPASGNLESNLQRHLALAKQAQAEGAELACFPELSLTGYHTRRAADWATTPADSRLEPLQQAARSLGIAIAIGLPLRAADGVQVGMIVFQPQRPRVVYAKRLLHADEVPWFVPGRSQAVLEIGGLVVVPAICFESLQEEHARQAAALGADVYLASVAKSAHGVQKARAHYPEMARRYGFSVVMANCVGPADDFIAAGQSAAWDAQGELRTCLDDCQEGLLVFDTENPGAQLVQASG
jgi:predicted amidohydrolase